MEIGLRHKKADAISCVGFVLAIWGGPFNPPLSIDWV
jgi:hypothetical protein